MPNPETRTIIQYKCTCLKCGHVWYSENVHPLRCPGKGCGRPDWDRPRKEVKEP